MISSDSPLRSLPTSLNSRQAMYFDGLRYAIEMLDISYRRLTESLVAVAATEEIGDLAPTVFQDAWSFVDSANRIRVIGSYMPGVKKKSPGQQQLLRGLSSVEDLRNSMQHLPGDIDEHHAEGLPTLGVLQWWHADSGVHARSFVLVPGSIRQMEGLGSTTPPSGFTSNPDHVVLHAYGYEVDLSKAYRVVATYTAALEASLSPVFTEHAARTGSDLLLVVAIGPADEVAGGTAV